jgi:hypothetical protein
MTDDTQLAALLRSALPPVAIREPSRDLWPAITNRSERRMPWSWVDVGLAALVLLSMAAWPETMLLLAYHF